MSYEQRKINRQKREKRYKVIIISVGLILLLIMFSSFFTKKIKTILPVEDTFIKDIELQSALIKHEKVFKLNDTKDIDKSLLEGKRIPIGTKVGNSTILNDLNSLKNELKEVESAIDTLEKSNKDKVYINNKNNLLENYKQEVEELQESIYIKDYNLINDFKDRIVSTRKDINDLIPQEGLLGQSVESLKEKQEKLIKNINQTDSSYTSKMSGILSYEIDGYENIYKPENFNSYTYDKISLSEEDKKKSDKEVVTDNIVGFKIIDNFQWYLAMKIDNRKDISKYDIGDTLYISYPIEKEYLELKGNIISINNSSNNSVIIIELNKHLHKFYKDRFPKVRLIQEKLQGFKIPNNVILEKDKQKGVYIKDFSGIVKFKAIKIIASKDDYTYIAKGENGLISIENGEKEVATVSIYDEILIKPSRFKEGEIIE